MTTAEFRQLEASVRALTDAQLWRALRVSRAGTERQCCELTYVKAELRRRKLG